MDKQGWLKGIMEEAVKEVESRPVWMKPAELRQQEIGKRQKDSGDRPRTDVTKKPDER